LLLALANIDEIIATIRRSATQAEAKAGLMQIPCPAPLMERALGAEGWTLFLEERGVAEMYTLTAVQADAILKMTLGQLVNLEQERLGEEHAGLLAEIRDHLSTLGDEQKIYRIIKDDLQEIRRKHADERRTQITGEEIGNIDVEDLIEEENMVVSISHRGYIKRTPVSVYRAQRRGGKGLQGARTEDEDPIEHVFAASTHDYMLFFSTTGRVYWRKIYELPQQRRDSRGRAIVNLLQLAEGEEIADCRAIRDFSAPDHYLMMATRRGLIKKTPLAAYGRPRRMGIIAIKLREDDEIVNVVVVRGGDDVVLATASGMAIRFDESDARPMGRNTSGVKGITLVEGDEVVGMVVVDPNATLLTACENGYGKRTWFGQAAEETDDESSGNMRYRRQRRGGKGLRDIKTTERNGKVIGICPVIDEDDILLMTSRGKLQRISCSDINPIGRNTQGVRIMKLDEGDTLAAVVRVPRDENDEAATPEPGPANAAPPTQPSEG
jgi:DNA gyrase subunit A